jgi:hypothetical protein
MAKQQNWQRRLRSKHRAALGESIEHERYGWSDETNQLQSKF